VKWDPKVCYLRSLDAVVGDSLIWLGHNSFFLQLAGKRIMFDPVFGNIPFVKRQSEFPANPDIFTEIDYLLISHDHFDHYSGNTELINKYAAKIYTHRHSKITNVHKYLNDQEIIYEYNNYQLIAIESPGHTLNHLMFLLKKDHVPYALFTGDCFFNAGVGNCYNGGNVKSLYQTIKNVFTKLPDEILIYPGHEYLKKNLEFTLNFEYENKVAEEFLTKLKTKDPNQDFFVNNLKLEKEINLFLRLNSKLLQDQLNIYDEERMFIQLRELRNKW
jgi:hydroxyacylglutathione hydrolase